jgi:hypothetical protein
MELQNGEVWAAWEPLSKLLEKEWPVKVSYKLAQMARLLREEYDLIEQVRSGLIKKYGTENGANQVSVDPESEQMPKFILEYNELMEGAVEIAFTKKVVLPATADGQEIQVEPLVLMALDKFVTVE